MKNIKSFEEINENSKSIDNNKTLNPSTDRVSAIQTSWNENFFYIEQTEKAVAFDKKQSKELIKQLQEFLISNKQPILGTKTK